MPMGKATEEWSFGDLEAGFKNAALVVDETFVVQSTGHHPMETRSAMAYWQNGKLYLHGSTQSVIRTVDGIARWCGIEPSQVVLICEYCGGGFGSKGGGAVSMAIPALLSKKANAPVMMRVSREEESYFGRARTNMTGRVKIGFREGRPHHRARSLHRPGQRTLRSDGRSPLGGQRRVAHLSAGGHAVARHQRPHQHAAAHAAAIARTDAGQRHHRAGHHEGGAQARHRSGRDSPDQCAGWQGDVRSTGRKRSAAPRHERVRTGGARSRRRSRSSGASGRRAPASGSGSKVTRRRRRRSGRTARDRSATTA